MRQLYYCRGNAPRPWLSNAKCPLEPLLVRPLHRAVWDVNHLAALHSISQKSRAAVVYSTVGLTGPGDASEPDGGGDSSPREDSRRSPVKASGPAYEGAADCQNLRLSSEILERVAKLRALDAYRQLMSEAAASGHSACSRPKPQLHRDLNGGKRTGIPGAAVPGGSSPSSPVPRISPVVGLDDDSSFLLRGALLIARHRYPSFDETKVYGMLDDMARRVLALLPADLSDRYPPPLRVVAAINRVLYTDYGLRGNEEDYYNADNSCINRVMERRAGIPITLSLVYMEVAHRVGLPMRGLNLPGHFMLQPLWPEQHRRTNINARVGSSSFVNCVEQQQPRCDSSDGSVFPDALTKSGSGAGAGCAAGVGPGGATGNVQDEAMEQRAGDDMVAAAGCVHGKVDGNDVDHDGEEDEEAGTPLEVLVDTFRSGEVCFPGEVEERISAVLGYPVHIDPQVLKESQPLAPRMFLLRMLSNLRSIYLSTQQVDLLLEVLKFMRVTLLEEEEEGQSASALGKGAKERRASSPRFSSFGDYPVSAAAASVARDEGLCYFALRRYPECLEALREYLGLAEQSGNGPLPPDEVQTVLAVMEEARRRMMQQPE